MEKIMIFKSFFELGQWWFRGRSYPLSHKKYTAKEINSDLSKKQIQREMSSNRCIGGHFTEEV
jgi:hypothetical protein